MVFFQIIFDDPIDSIAFFGHLLLFIFLILYSIFMYISGKKSDIESQKEFFYGFASFVVTLNFAIILYIFILLKDVYGYGDFLPRIIRIGGTGYEYILLMLFAFGFIFLMKPIEKYIQNREKLWITNLSKIAFILLLIPYIGGFIYSEGDWGTTYWTWAAYPGLGVFAISALFSIFGSFYFYLRLGFQSTGSVRKKGFLTGSGILLLYLGLLSTQISGIGNYNRVIGPIVMVIGAILTLIGHRIVS